MRGARFVAIATIAAGLLLAAGPGAEAQAPEVAPEPNPYRTPDAGAVAPTPAPETPKAPDRPTDPQPAAGADGGTAVEADRDRDGGPMLTPVPSWELGSGLGAKPDGRDGGAAAAPPPAEPDPGEGDRAGEDAEGAAPDEGATQAPAEPAEPSFVPIPVPSASGDSDGTWELARELFPVLPEGRTGSVLGLLVALLAALVGTSIARRVRDALPNVGVFPRVLQVVHTLLRLLVAGLLIALVVRIVPAWMGPALPWVLLATAAAIGWSARDLLPDVVAGVVMMFERRIRRGVWISGDEFSGTVLGVGLRATWVVDARGHRIAVPNRRLMSGPIVSDSAVGAEHEVTLRMDAPSPAGRVRQALRDAVLQSPWVPPQAEPVVLRDPDEPHLWHVRSRLLEARYAPQFEGELLERAEEILAHGSAGTFLLDEELDDA